MLHFSYLARTVAFPPVALSKKQSTFCTATAPSGQRVICLLQELGLECELKSVALQEGEHRTPQFREELNPAGLIPVLVDHDAADLKVFESGAVMMYLLECKAPAAGGEVAARAAELLPAPSEGARRAAVLTWMFFLHGTFYAAVRRFFAPLIVGAPSTPDTQRYAGEALAEQLRILDGQLQKTGTYVAGDSFSAADCSALPYALGTAVAIGIDLPKELPAMNAWVERVLARPGMRRGLQLPSPYPFFSAGPEGEAAVEGLRSKLSEMGFDPISGKDAGRVLVEE
ncbi:hypothetical protein ABPG75_009133 [Micractinium tetrahymenae]